MLAMAAATGRSFVRRFSSARGLAAAAAGSGSSSIDIAHKLIAVGALKAVVAETRRGAAELQDFLQKLKHSFCRKPYLNFACYAGDALVQNDADSEIGKAVIKLAKEQQIKTINIIKDKPGALDRVEDLKELGGDIVVTEAYTNTWYMQRLLSDFPKPTLGINFSQGSAATAVARLLTQGATLVTYGTELPQWIAYLGASRRPFSWPEFLKAKKLQAEAL